MCVVPGHSQCNWQQVQLSLPRFPNCPLACAVLSAAACLCLRKPEEESEGRARSCRGWGDGSKPLYRKREKRKMMVSAGRRSTTFAILLRKVASKSCRQIGTKLAVWYFLKKINVWSMNAVGQEYDCAPISLVLSSAAFCSFCLNFLSAENDKKKY